MEQKRTDLQQQANARVRLWSKEVTIYLPTVDVLLWQPEHMETMPQTMGEVWTVAQDVYVAVIPDRGVLILSREWYLRHNLWVAMYDAGLRLLLPFHSWDQACQQYRSWLAEHSQTQHARDRAVLLWLAMRCEIAKIRCYQMGPSWSPTFTGDAARDNLIAQRLLGAWNAVSEVESELRREAEQALLRVQRNYVLGLGAQVLLSSARTSEKIPRSYAPESSVAQARVLRYFARKLQLLVSQVVDTGSDKNVQKESEAQMNIDTVVARGKQRFGEMRETARTAEEREAVDIADRAFEHDVRNTPMVRELALDSEVACDLLCKVYAAWPPTDQRLSLYERCSQALLSRPEVDIQQEQRGTVERPVLDYLQRKRFVCDLAYWMIRNDFSRVEEETFMARLGRACAATPPWNFSPPAVLRVLLALGVVRRTGEQIAFTSHLLQAYYAACEAAEQGDVGLLINEALRPSYRQVVVFAAGLLKPDQSLALISGLTARGEREAAAREEFHQLASACLELAPTIARDRLRPNATARRSL